MDERGVCCIETYETKNFQVACDDAALRVSQCYKPMGHGYVLISATLNVSAPGSTTPGIMISNAHFLLWKAVLCRAGLMCFPLLRPQQLPSVILLLFPL